MTELKSTTPRDIIYDLVYTGVDHILKQNERSHNEGSCLYRTDTGLKCAVGALIKDCYYNHFIENQACSNYLVWGALVKSNPIINELDPVHQRVLEQYLKVLQNIHDTKDIDKWPVLTTELLEEIKNNTMLVQ